MIVCVVWTVDSENTGAILFLFLFYNIETEYKAWAGQNIESIAPKI